MTTTVTPDLKPDHTDSEARATARPDLIDTTPEGLDSHSFDPTQGRKVGSDAYDDPTRAR